MDRLVIIHGAPIFGPSPLETFIVPLIRPLGIEIQTIERNNPLEFSVFSGADDTGDRCYVISHSHGGNWMNMAAYHMPWFGGKLGWSSIDPVRFTTNDESWEVKPEFLPQIKNIPFIVPAIVTTCRAYHRRLPFDRNLAASIPLPLAMAEFPFNSLTQGSVDGQDVIDTEVYGKVSEVLEWLGLAIDGTLGRIIGSVLGSFIDHSTICAAVAPQVLKDMTEFFA